MPSLASLAILLGVIAVVGCASVADLAKNEPPICEIHQVVMPVKEVGVVNGTSVYLPEYHARLLTPFPHHGGMHFAEDHGYLTARKLRLRVCPRCDEAYEAWRTISRKPVPPSATAPSSRGSS